MEAAYLIEATYQGPDGRHGYKYGQVYDLDLEINTDIKIFVSIEINFRIDPRPLSCMSYNLQSLIYKAREFFLAWTNIKMIKDKKEYDPKKYPYADTNFIHHGNK